jgi:hypothetical protein
MNDRDKDEVRNLIGEALGKHREARHSLIIDPSVLALDKRIEQIEKFLDITWVPENVIQRVEPAHYEPIQITKKK